MLSLTRNHKTAAQLPEQIPPTPPGRDFDFSREVYDKAHVAAFLVISTRQVERLMSDDPTFPKPMRVGRAGRWWAAEIRGWLEQSRKV